MKFFFISLSILTSLEANSYCSNYLGYYSSSNCRSQTSVQAVRSCIANVESMIYSCRQEMLTNQQAMATRNQKLLDDEVQKLKEATVKLLGQEVTNKQNARYLALKDLDGTFTNYSDSIKTAIARSNQIYKELLALDLSTIDDSNRSAKVGILEKINKRLNIESQNAQAYFNGSKNKLLALESLLQINITDAAIIPVLNLKKQNEEIISIVKDAINAIKTNTHVSSTQELSFPASLEDLVKEEIQQEVVMNSCKNNPTVVCGQNQEKNKLFNSEIDLRLKLARAQIAQIANEELKIKLLDADKKNDLPEFARLYDFAVSAGAIK